MMPLAPSATAFTMSGVGKLASTMSDEEATSAGDFARCAPRAPSGAMVSLWVS
jgi:hypothetical protein